MPAKPKPPPNESVTYNSGPHEESPDLRLLHYNDVYHVDPSSAEPVGGVSRFMTLIKHYRDGDEYQDQPKLITAFSGDAFNPSLESSVTKGMAQLLQRKLGRLLDGGEEALPTIRLYIIALDPAHFMLSLKTYHES
jgi:hypothetical protein